ncbi:hypothetical protein GJ744_010311 [Endocarpon pusillum]|uniref:Uncharacterized protein n=1 Tax=Endocarpon pusillum TaxID=364733 RepID=A0A8H7E3P5_9EURO|nr:hypothetical protein GJ744_010311 [Endocarpon pusillum]
MPWEINEFEASYSATLPTIGSGRSMQSTLWIREKQTVKEEAYEDGEEAPGRNLAEHFERSITLSHLELFSAAVSALKARATSTGYTRADLAYALMGLLRYRVDTDPTEDLFQVITRLSLANDNDGLIEHLIPMVSEAIHNKEEFIRCFAAKDRNSALFKIYLVQKDRTKSAHWLEFLRRNTFQLLQASVA